MAEQGNTSTASATPAAEKAKTEKKPTLYRMLAVVERAEGNKPTFQHVDDLTASSADAAIKAAVKKHGLAEYVACPTNNWTQKKAEFEKTDPKIVLK